MSMRTLLTGLCILCGLFTCCRADGSQQERLAHYIHARGYFIADAESGKVVAKKNWEGIVPVASTTKMVTALTARSLVKDNPVVTISREVAAVTGARAGLCEGEKYQFNDLLRAMLVRSANDAATAIAIAAGGSKKKFVEQMNLWCSAHGYKNSHFEDPAGLSSQSVSTPEDLANIAKEFLSVSEFEASASLDTFTLTSFAGRNIPLRSLNVLHHVMPEDVLSLKGKTGFTKKAKYCFAGRAVTPKGKWFIAVTGADSSWQETYMLVKYCNGELELTK